MTLAPNTRLGRYEIRSKLGAGGMGEVYLAHDPKLNREVAIKVLPTSFSANAERLARFEQEACAAGALNHPNILSVYDVGAENGAPYIVSELLEGETLRERLNGTALPTRKAIDYALQIARGLSAAHERGIIHRDLKPENIFITNDGRVKILDFGLAKLTQAETSGAQTEIPTRRVDTDPGAVMGTVGYMAPEQVRGQAVDHRADIFSFGAVLYEMLAGQRAFRGESAADTLSAILKEDPPDLSESNRNVSLALERVVQHCLEKNPAERFHSARDLAFALEALSGSTTISSETMTTPSLPARRFKHRELFAWITAGIAAVIAALAFAASYSRRAPTVDAPVMRFTILPTEKEFFIGPPSISPDGRRLVFITRDATGKSKLWLRSLDSPNAKPLPGTEDGFFTFWSPDSRFIGFFARGKLKKIDVTGGVAQTVAEADGLGGTWNSDGVILSSRGAGGGIFRIPATGGEPTPVTTLDESRKELGHFWPRFLPDGRHFLYVARSTQRENSAIYVGSLDSKEKKFLLNADSNAIYAPPGYLLFMREQTLLAQAFDADKLQLTGEPAIVAEHVTYNAQISLGLFSVSQTGVLLYRSGGFTPSQLAWFDRSGKQLGVIAPSGASGILGSNTTPQLSPDGKRVAFARSDPQTQRYDLWLCDLASGTSSRFTFDSANNHFPVWSPDGSRIVFASSKEGLANLYQKPSSGAGNEELLLKSDNPKLPTDWSPDGRFILYTDSTPKAELWVLPLFGERKPMPVVQTKSDATVGKFSPDGRWIAYTSDESGQNEVYVQSFPP